MITLELRKQQVHPQEFFRTILGQEARRAPRHAQEHHAAQDEHCRPEQHRRAGLTRRRAKTMPQAGAKGRRFLLGRLAWIVIHGTHSQLEKQNDERRRI